MKFRNWFCFSEIILSYTLATTSSGTDFSFDDSTTIRYVKIHIYWIDRILINNDNVFQKRNSLNIFFQLRGRFGNNVSMPLFKKCVCKSGCNSYNNTNWRRWRYRRLFLFYVDRCWWTRRQYRCNYYAKSQFRSNCSKVSFWRVFYKL